MMPLPLDRNHSCDMPRGSAIGSLENLNRQYRLIMTYRLYCHRESRRDFGHAEERTGDVEERTR
jgi:hypothetical protein